jgi:hypothetical protein
MLTNDKAVCVSTAIAASTSQWPKQALRLERDEILSGARNAHCRMCFLLHAGQMNTAGRIMT